MNNLENLKEHNHIKQFLFRMEPINLREKGSKQFLDTISYKKKVKGKKDLNCFLFFSGTF